MVCMPIVVRNRFFNSKLYKDKLKKNIKKYNNKILFIILNLIYKYAVDFSNVKINFLDVGKIVVCFFECDEFVDKISKVLSKNILINTLRFVKANFLFYFCIIILCFRHKPDCF